VANRLIHEQSPYLLQHAHNPVDWYPWGDEAFERAEHEQKPVLVSIGYAACHWCHVMERESFEDLETAAFMNEHFVCIKVDREEYPDVDQLYMDAVQAISGSGGWPLNVFLTPQRVPFYGGTYYPPRPAFSRPSWRQLLQRIHEIWSGQRGEVEAQAEQMIRFLEESGKGSRQGTAWDMQSVRHMAETLLQQADTQDGGFGRAPKFPASMALGFLLEHAHFTGHQPSVDHAVCTLDKMLGGGIYDHLGGGFARYATDSAWRVPHFEKMLYDNALMVLTLCDAYSLTKKERYRQAIAATIGFVERELKDPSGGYYSALDADSEGVEGKYYTWTWQEWTEALGQPDEAVTRYFGVTEQGNWEGVNILHTPEPPEVVAGAAGISVEALSERVAAAKARLLLRREQRPRPLTDDKALLSWNALMNLALTRAAAVLGSDSYRERAIAHMLWMTDHFQSREGWMRVWKQGTARIAATLEDHACLTRALLELGSLSGDHRWIRTAVGLMEATQTHFRDPESPFFFCTPADKKDIPVRRTDRYDGALPSANALQAHNLLLLSLCTGRTEWQEQAMELLSVMASAAMRYPSSFGYWATLLQRAAAGIRLVVATGPAARQHAAALSALFLPQAFLLTSEKEISDLPVLEGKFFPGESPIFVCSLQACHAPVYDITAALPLLGP
jgi:uncharacterized protein YyaL (SSP411 family)